MPHIDCEAVRALGVRIEEDVIPILTEVNDILLQLVNDPEVRITQALYTAVDISLATAYTVALSYMSEAVQGAAECFRDMNVKLDTCAANWERQDESLAAGFQRAISG